MFEKRNVIEDKRTPKMEKQADYDDTEQRQIALFDTKKDTTKDKKAQRK